MECAYKENHTDEELLELIKTGNFNYLRESSVIIVDLVKIIKVLDSRIKSLEEPRTRFG